MQSGGTRRRFCRSSVVEDQRGWPVVWGSVATCDWRHRATWPTTPRPSRCSMTSHRRSAPWRNYTTTLSRTHSQHQSSTMKWKAATLTVTIWLRYRRQLCRDNTGVIGKGGVSVEARGHVLSHFLEPEARNGACLHIFGVKTRSMV